MNEYQADRSLSAMSKIIPLSGESANLVRDILQCPLCVFATSIRPEFTKHLISHCTPKRNNSSLKTVLKSPLNQHGDNYCSLFTREYIREKLHETEERESSLRISRVGPRSNVRDKSFREAKNCKQCNFIASTKMEYWEHMRCHIKGFTCSECSFVTKYKHHMNHHWLSVHDGSKPFKCKKCLYTCVSKSMLTSHLKKHSNVYPYKCADCTYKTKFCNALKKHLRKKEHQPAIVLNADGAPNPLSIIDVYGIRRGPRQKLSAKYREEVSRSSIHPTTTTNNQLDSTAVTSPPLSLHSSIARYLTVTAINGVNNGHWINHNGTNKNQSVATLPYSDLVAAFNLSNHVLLREDESVHKSDDVRSGTLSEYAKILNAEDKMPEMFAKSLPVTYDDATNDISEPHTSDNVKIISESSTFVAVKSQIECRRTESTDVPLDLRIIGIIRKNQLQFQTLADTNSLKISGTSKRKGKAMKLERDRLIKEGTDKKPADEKRNERVQWDSGFNLDEINRKIKDTKDGTVANLFDAKMTCHYCEIIFGNVMMYTVHMACHSFDDPYTCNICGHRYTDKLSFFLHIARSEH